jgi:hypothetical protein
MRKSSAALDRALALSRFTAHDVVLGSLAFLLTEADVDHRATG